jgi:hypothetical protein
MVVRYLSRVVSMHPNPPQGHRDMLHAQHMHMGLTLNGQGPSIFSSRTVPDGRLMLARRRRSLAGRFPRSLPILTQQYVPWSLARDGGWMDSGTVWPSPCSSVESDRPVRTSEAVPRLSVVAFQKAAWQPGSLGAELSKVQYLTWVLWIVSHSPACLASR